MIVVAEDTVAAAAVVVVVLGKDATTRNGGRPEQNRVGIQTELFLLWQLLLLLLLKCLTGCIHSVAWMEVTETVIERTRGPAQFFGTLHKNTRPSHRHRVDFC